MKKLPINLDELAFVLHRGEDLKMECFLNLKSGEILYVPTDTEILRSLLHQISPPELLNTKALAESLFGKNNNLIYIPDNFKNVVFDLMSGFTNLSVLSDQIQNKLVNAIQREGGFNKFHQILCEIPDLLKKFIEFRDDFFLEKALEWLKEQNIIPAENKNSS